jgi:hypothetical protein
MFKNHILLLIAIAVVNSLYAQSYKKEPVNLVVNGDFAEGNAAFTSAYKALQPGDKAAAGLYMVTDNPMNMNGAYCKVTDSNGAGNMMVIDTSPNGSADVIWKQEVKVRPNTIYAFAINAAALYGEMGSPVELDVRINDTRIISQTLPLGPQTCQWQQYTAQWLSGNATTAALSIASGSHEYINSDVAIDNIRFFAIANKNTVIPEASNLARMEPYAPLMEEVTSYVVIDEIPDAAITDVVEVAQDEPMIEQAPPAVVELAPDWSERRPERPKALYVPHPLPPGVKNLIVNGDFAKGNSKFNTAYTFLGTGQAAAGKYTIINNPLSMNGHYCSMGDHTTGEGDMMVVDGSVNGAQALLWEQEVPVKPDQNYTFSISAVSLFGYGEAPVLAVDINGARMITQELPGGNLICQWQQYLVTWNPGTSPRAKITIYCESTDSMGNDFALDDIQLYAEGTGKRKKRKK